MPILLCIMGNPISQMRIKGTDLKIISIGCLISPRKTIFKNPTWQAIFLKCLLFLFYIGYANLNFLMKMECKLLVCTIFVDLLWSRSCNCIHPKGENHANEDSFCRNWTKCIAKWRSTSSFFYSLSLRLFVIFGPLRNFQPAFFKTHRCKRLDSDICHFVPEQLLHLSSGKTKIYFRSPTDPKLHQTN